MKITLVVVVYHFNFEGLLELNAEAPIIVQVRPVANTDLGRHGTNRTPPGDFRRPMTTFPTFIIQNYIISCVGSNKIIHSVVKTRPSNWFELLVNGDGLRFLVVRSEVVILRANG